MITEQKELIRGLKIRVQNGVWNFKNNDLRRLCCEIEILERYFIGLLRHNYDEKKWRRCLIVRGKKQGMNYAQWSH